MVAKAGFKAGLIGLAALLVMVVINQFLPAGVLVYLSCGVSMLIYVGIGVLAGRFLESPRTPGKGSGAGAIAGAISATINGIVGSTIMIIRWTQGWGLPGVDPQQMQMLVESGMNPMLTAIPGAICGLAMGVGVAAIGGAIYAAIQPD